MTIQRRIERIERDLSMIQEPVVHQIVWFGGGPLPQATVDGVWRLEYVRYADLKARAEA